MDVPTTRVLLASALLAFTALGARADVLDCTSEPPGAPPHVIELLSPTGPGPSPCRARVRGTVSLATSEPLDVYVVVDSSGSTAGASGQDVDGDGLLGAGDWRANTDPGDSTLAAELEAVRRALDAWEARDVRVALVEYSAVIPIPPGEPSEQGRIRTVQGLTSDHAAVRRALDAVRAAGSVGATDYGGALLELAAEIDRSHDPARRPVAFFLSDGKPTFPRFPYDATETPDVEWALDGARTVAARDVPVHALEIGTFDDLRVLLQVAALTGGTILPGLSGGELLDALATFSLDGFTEVEVRNGATGAATWATLSATGDFEADLALVNGVNDLVITAVLRTPAGEWTITCPVTIDAYCLERPGDGGGGGGSLGGDGGLPTDDGGGGGGGSLGEDGGGVRGGTTGGRLGRGREDFGGLVGRYQRPWPVFHPWTADRISRWADHPCIALGSGPGLGSDCDEALRQLTALLMSIEVGELALSCLLDADVVPDHATVGELIAALESALDRASQWRCRDAAEAAALVTSGAGLAEQVSGPAPGPSGPTDCRTILDGTDVDVTVQITSPPSGTVVGAGEDCAAAITIVGGASAGGTGAHDVYFVVDTSGSTAGDSGRDVDGDGANETTLEAELEAVRAFVALLDPATVRVALVEFSAVLPIPPGEPSEQGRIRTVQPLTADFAAFGRALDDVLAEGPVGATDYGGALAELAAEYDRNGDATRGSVAFFLSDGKPTFPRFPYDSTEVLDVDHALQGADACAARGITVNTFELGVFDDLAVLLDVASRTGGRFYGDLADGAVLEALPGSSLVGIEDVVVTNLLTGQVTDAQLSPDGSFSARVNVAPGENPIVVRIVSDGGEEIVECTLTLVGECAWPPCAARPPAAWFDEDCR